MESNLKPRVSAVFVLDQVLTQKKTVDMAIGSDKEYSAYSESDRHFIKLLVLTTLRRMGQIDGVLSSFIHKKIPNKNRLALMILRMSVAQYLFLKTPDYAVVNTAVALTKAVKLNALSGFVNAVLRSLMRAQNPLAAYEDVRLNIPKWMIKSWEKEYGKEKAKAIAEAVLTPPLLEITVAEKKEELARRWGGVILPTGSIRVEETNPEALAGFLEEKAWVQNASAAVPAQLFSDVRGKKVADLCAAPGGKTAQLAARGALVFAFDISEKRLKRLSENMARLGYGSKVQTQVADVSSMAGEGVFDAVLLDAPCSATGTLARHPEVKYHQTEADVKRLAALQKQLLEKAVVLTKKGGEIVFSTCSIEPEEGDAVVRSVSGVEVVRPMLKECQPFVTEFGSLRFLPTKDYDGFYACLLKKK